MLEVDLEASRSRLFWERAELEFPRHHQGQQISDDSFMEGETTSFKMTNFTLHGSLLFVHIRFHLTQIQISE